MVENSIEDSVTTGYFPHLLLNVAVRIDRPFESGVHVSIALLD
jgi:hypothetical protein